MIAWLVTTSKRSGSISVATTGNVTNAVAGNLASWGVGAIMAVVLSFLFPRKYHEENPEYMARANKISGISTSPKDESGTVSPTPKRAPESCESASQAGEKGVNAPGSAPQPESLAPTGNAVVDQLEARQIEPMDPVLVKKGERLATIACWIYFLIALILVPFTLFGTGYVYSRSFFKGWVTVSFIWVWCSMVICVIYPVVESAGSLSAIAKGFARDSGALFGRRKPKAAPQPESIESKA